MNDVFKIFINYVVPFFHFHTKSSSHPLSHACCFIEEKIKYQSTKNENYSSMLTKRVSGTELILVLVGYQKWLVDNGYRP